MRRFTSSRLALAAPLAVLIASGYGCGAGKSSDPVVHPGEDPALAKLEADTGVKWSIRRSAGNGEIRTLAPATAVPVGNGTPEQKARQFFARYRDLFHGTGKADELRLAREPDVDRDGTTHVRFEHFLPGTTVPVLDTASSVSFEADGNAYFMQPGFWSGLDKVPTHASITEREAVDRAVSRAAAQCGADAANVTTNGAQLAVRGDEDHPLLLIWRVPMRPANGSCSAPEALIDATTGEIVSITETAQGVWDTGAKGVR